jgi:two-component system, cell cycle response regulator
MAHAGGLLVAHRLLLIDDSPALARLVEAKLHDEGVELHYAADGLTGLEMARSLKPDLILLDVEMPAPDGFEVCRRLKLEVETLAIPIIFLSGVSGTGDKILGLELGAVDFVAKPFDAADIRARVRSALRLKRLSDLLASKARVDGVTGLWNAEFFTARVSAELALGRRALRPLAVVLADIDHFRRLNSEHGPWFGDEVLATVADTLARGVRQEDVLCRFDSATLGIVCPSSTTDGALAMSQRLATSISALRMTSHGTQLGLTVSFGISGIHWDSPSASLIRAGGAASLITAARNALALAKGGGRNRINVAEESCYPTPPPQGGVVQATAPERRAVCVSQSSPSSNAA